MTKKYALIFDVDLCTDCNNCTIALQDEYVGNEFPGYAVEMPKHGHRWIDIKRKERGTFPFVDVAYLAEMCQHCDQPPCARNAQNGAVYKRPDGIVVIDPLRAKGQRQLVADCPYGAIWWNEEKQVPQHWNFDAHLIDAGWNEPRCAQVCPTGAMKALYVDDEELQRIKVSQNLEVLRPELPTRPRVFYRNLYRYRSAFIAGSVATEDHGVEDCVVGATVRLFREDFELRVTQTDVFGDFKFDNLEEDGKFYSVEAVGLDRLARSSTIALSSSAYLGVLYLK